MARLDDQKKLEAMMEFGLQQSRLEGKYKAQASDRKAGGKIPQEAAGWKEKEEMDLRRGVASVASAASLGDFFQYKIDHAVNLARQKSAMLPILAKDVEGTRVSIYNQATHAKFPLLGLKFKNTTGMNLMQGPLTVFDGDNYAGDARILDLQPNEERLMSYAVDLGTEVEAVNPTSNGKLTKVKLNKGILYSTTKLTEGKVYHVKNRTKTDRLLVLEHPYRQEFNLVSAVEKDAEKKDHAIKPSERARDVYRFEISVPAGKTATTEITEDRDLVSTVQLTNADDQTMRYFFSQPITSSKVKLALEKAITLKDKLAATQQELGQVNRDLKNLSDDQARLRANIKELPSTAAVYKVYLDKMFKQETEIEKLQTGQKKLQDNELTQRKDFETYLASLDVE